MARNYQDSAMCSGQVAGAVGRNVNDFKDEIAIVGVGCRFPGADNLEEFWKVLVNGENHVREVDNARWDFNSIYDPDENAATKSYVNKAGLLANIDGWDNHLFGVSDMEARTMDPQQKLVLECCHMAMEDAGITRKHLDGSNTSVFIGAMNDDYKTTQQEFIAGEVGYVVTGMFRSILSARLSYAFNLKGPCMVVDTACSSSLTAIHLARQSLLLNESDLAIAGGVSVLLDPQPFVNLSNAHMLSPSGQCHTFTSDADGYARGEGCGIVFLQRLSDALAQGNTIWGTIQTGINQDGHMVTPMTAPSMEQQYELLERVYRNRKEDMNAVQVIEAHGTGTVIGDPTEVTALGSFFKDSKTAKMSNIKIGSVKTNIGHLESAAGVAGLVKVLLMMKNEKVVPSLMFSEEKRNPKLDFKGFNFLVPTETVYWPLGESQTRTACVNSFGFGGSNSHLLIKQWLPKSTVKSTVMSYEGLSKDKPHLFVLSCTQKTGLANNLNIFMKDIEHLESSLKEISMTSLLRRDHFKFRVAIAATSKAELKQKCVKAAKRVEGLKLSRSPRVVYVFCGVGTTWNGMCIELLQNCLFRETVVTIDKELQQYTGWSVVEKWENHSNVTEPLIGHISIFVCQLGIAALWKKMNVVPDVVVGQSVGEVAACYIAGLIDLKTAVKLIYYRSYELSICSKGGMLVVRNADINAIEKLCLTIGSVNIAVYISPKACTVSGDRNGLRQLEQILKDMDGVTVKQLDVPCGYHSQLVKDAGYTLEKRLVGQLTSMGVTNAVPIISTVYGKGIDRNEFLKGSYWRQNVIEPVQFHAAIQDAKGKNENTVYIEIGPSPVLKVHMSDIFDNNTACVSVSSVERKREYSTILQSIGTMYEMGCRVDFKAIFDDTASGRPSSIPRYEFNKNIFPVRRKTNPNKAVGIRYDDGGSHSYIVTNDESDIENGMCIKISHATTPYVYEHFVRDTVVVPGALYADVGFEIGNRLLGLPTDKLSVSYDILGSVSIPDRNDLQLEIKLQELREEDSIGYKFGVLWGTAAVCQGVVKEVKVQGKYENVDISPLLLFLPDRVTSDDQYEGLGKFGYRYGKGLRVLQNGVADSKRCLIDVSLSEDVWKEIEHSHIHPSLLDGMMQSVHIKSETVSGNFIVPIGMDSITLRPKLRDITKSSKLQILVEMTNHTSLESMEKMHFDMFLVDRYKTVLVQINNFVLYGSRKNTKGCDDLRYIIGWKKQRDDVLEKNDVTSHMLEGMTFVNASDEFISMVQDIKDGRMQVDFKSHKSGSEKISSDLALTFGSSKFVVLFVDPNAISNYDCSKEIMEALSNNLQTIQKVILGLKSTSNGTEEPDLIIVTMGVHASHYPGEYKKNVSLLGSETWGFIRNFQLEFFYQKVTLVDIDSCKLSTVNTLIDLMGTFQGNPLHEREFCIVGTQLLTMEVRASTKRYKTSSLRSNIKILDSPSSKNTLFSSRMQSIHDPFFMTNEDIETEVENNADFPTIKFEVSAICLHDRRIYPVTMPDVSDKYSLVTDEQMDGGYKILSIELIGKMKGNCRDVIQHSHDPEAGDNDVYVACYPCIASQVVRIPEECCIKRSHIGHYTPGLLSTSLILWELLEEVDNGSEIHIFHSSLPDQVLLLVQSILLKKGKECNVVHGTATTLDVRQPRKPVALVLQQLYNSIAYTVLQKYKCVVSLKPFLPDTLVEELRLSHGRKVVLFDATAALSDMRIRQTMTQLKALLTETDMKSKIEFQSRNKNEIAFGIPLETLAMPSSETSNIDHDHQVSSVKVSKEKLFDKMSSYIVVGGLTGVGWLIVELLAEMGAGVLVTFGRRNPTTEMMQKLISLQDKYSCKIEHRQVDISDEDHVCSTIRGLEKQYPNQPIRGVFQGAGVNLSTTISGMTASLIDDVMRPKVQGAINLHLATRHLQLDYFVLLSSIISTVASFGQSLYGAANSFLDTFANYRRHCGLKAQSINWGGIATGMTQVGNVENTLVAKGHLLLKNEEFRSCFVHSLLTDETNVVYANLDKEVFRKTFDTIVRTSSGKNMAFLWENDYLSGRNSAQKKVDIFYQDWVKEGDQQGRLMLVEKVMKEFCSSAISANSDDFDAKASFVDMGIDSMSSIALTNLIRNYFGVDIKVAVIFDPETSIQTLTRIVGEEIDNKFA